MTRAWLATLLLATSATLGVCAPDSRPLVQRLGFAPTDRALIINCDDTGLCHGGNVATFEALTQGVATSATVMIPCAWVPEVVEWKKQHPEADLGVHLTLTSEWATYRWGPLLGRELCPSLLDKQGYLPGNCPALWAKAKPDEVYRECRAQIEAAIAAGLDPSHLDSHMDSLVLSPDLWPVYLRLAQEFRLPVRLASPALYVAVGAPGSARRVWRRRNPRARCALHLAGCSLDALPSPGGDPSLLRRHPARAQARDGDRTLPPLCARRSRPPGDDARQRPSPSRPRLARVT